MKKIILLFSLVLGILSLVPISAKVLAPKDRQVILISIDGFPAWIWKDPALVAPNLRKLAAEGAVAEAMQVSDPSITWINHTTLVTGVTPRHHGVLYNGKLKHQGPDKPPIIEQWVDKTELVNVPTLYDLAFDQGLTTAEVDWVAITGSKKITWSFPELPKPEGKFESELIQAGLLTAEECTWFGGPGGKPKNVTWRDQKWTAVTQHLIEKHQPNLLLYHTLNTDAVHHTAGPASWGSFSALAYADRLIGDLVESVEKAGLKDRTTFIITTDHGFKKVQNFILPNVVLKNAQHATALGNKIIKCEAAAIVQGGMAFVYITDPTRKEALIPQLKALFEQTEGVAQVVEGKDAHSLGMPTPSENNGTGDLILFAKGGYAFNNNAAGDLPVLPSGNYGGTHGYLSSDPDLDGIFIASGASIKKGLTIPKMRNLDVAPTIAKLLNLKLPQQEGQALESILISEEIQTK